MFDKVRIDPQSPEAFGATFTFDIPLKGHRNTESRGKRTSPQDKVKYATATSIVDLNQFNEPPPVAPADRDPLVR